jgi:hypothetical protein
LRRPNRDVVGRKVLEKFNTRKWEIHCFGISINDDVLARLAALVPPPRVHLTRYHGVFAPHAALRAAITPAGRGRRGARFEQGMSRLEPEAIVDFSKSLGTGAALSFGVSAQSATTRCRYCSTAAPNSAGRSPDRKAGSPSRSPASRPT